MARIADLITAGRTLSFEFFPPRADAGWLTLGHTIAELEALQPSFVSVTYGAGGSTRARTHDLVAWVRRETTIPPLAHLTCVGHTRAEVVDILERYREVGVENILALAGDPPADPAMAAASEFAHAIDLVRLVREVGGFSVGVAAHPELHPRSASRADDRRHLAEKLDLADFAITQFFFEPEPYERLADELAALGCDRPLIPGIMPVTNKAQVRRMAELSGAAFPAWLAARLDGVEDPDDVRRVGVEAATSLCAHLLDAGVPGLHLYTLNRSTATQEIARALDLGGHR